MLAGLCQGLWRAVEASVELLRPRRELRGQIFDTFVESEGLRGQILDTFVESEGLRGQILDIFVESEGAGGRLLPGNKTRPPTKLYLGFFFSVQSI